MVFTLLFQVKSTSTINCFDFPYTPYLDQPPKTKADPIQRETYYTKSRICTPCLLFYLFYFILLLTRRLKQRTRYSTSQLSLYVFKTIYERISCKYYSTVEWFKHIQSLNGWMSRAQYFKHVADNFVKSVFFCIYQNSLKFS